MSYVNLKNMKPLVINITNFVSINDVANVLTLIGASPIMTNDIREIEDLLKLASKSNGSLVINIGTIDKNQEENIYHAVKVANFLNVPVILDPVGAGATNLRTNICVELLKKYKIFITRGNSAEINSLLGNIVKISGVDCNESASLVIAKEFVSKFNCSVWISGKNDFLATSDETLSFFERGSKFLPKISGTGCVSSSIIGAYTSLFKNPMKVLKASFAHIICAAEKADEESNSTIEFKQNFMKWIENIKDEEINL